jgi:hypothetical protein
MRTDLEWFHKRKVRRNILRQLSDIDKYYEPELALATGNKRREIDSHRSADLHELLCDLRAMDTEGLLRTAAKFDIDCYREGWFEDKMTHMGERILTDDAARELRHLVRAERRETVEWRLKIAGGIIAALTGLIGALIGLVTVLKR